VRVAAGAWPPQGVGRSEEQRPRGCECRWEWVAGWELNIFAARGGAHKCMGDRDVTCILDCGELRLAARRVLRELELPVSAQLGSSAPRWSLIHNYSKNKLY